jgi:signal transduction protein with GAF and PtsI domain
MPIGKGIAGCCAKARQIINVQNAYVDNRFNSDMDIKTNYKTRTVLACPIMERDRCLGVLQCVNKNTGHFNNDDEALLTILADFSRTVLTNTMNHDEEVLIKNKLRYTVKTGMVLSKLLGNQQNLLIQAQVRLKSMMGVDIARVIVHNADERQLSFYLEDTSFSKVPDKLGIAGEVIATGKMVNTYNCYTHPSFNPTVDLQTSMPVIIMPIIRDD